MDGLAIAASLGELREAVEGGFIQTAHHPTRDAIVLRVSGSGKPRILISPRGASIHLTSLAIANPRQPSTFAMQLRKHLRGGRIVAVRQAGWDRVVTVEIERVEGSRAETVELVAELIGPRGNLLIVRDGTVVGQMRRDARNAPGAAHQALARQEKHDPGALSTDAVASLLSDGDVARALARTVDGVGRETADDVVRAARADARSLDLGVAIRAKLAELVDYIAAPSPFVDADGGRATFYPLAPPAERVSTFAEALDRVVERRGGLRSEGVDEGAEAAHLARALSRRLRTADKLRDWLVASEDAERLRHHADLLLTHRTALPGKSASVSVTDPATEAEIEIRLDPTLTAIGNAQRLYRRARRLVRGRPRVEQRLARVDREIATLRRAIDAVGAGGKLPPEAAGFLPPTNVDGAPGVAGGRRFTIGGYSVFVGRNAADNDRLLRDASPDDVWLHARGVSGAHVVIRRGGRREIPDDVLEEAARLAARHSGAKGERRVEVSVAAAKRVRKPKGAPPGLAIVENEDTLVVDLDPRERR